MPPKNYSYQVKNSDFLVFVEEEKGKTTIVNAHSQEKILETPYLIKNAVTMVNNTCLIGHHERNLLIVDLVNKRYKCIDSLHLNILDCISVSDECFALMGYCGANFFFIKDYVSFNRYPATYIPLTEAVCGISNNQFFAQRGGDYYIYQINVNAPQYHFDTIRKQKMSEYINFRELLLLSDNKTIIGRTDSGVLYLIDTVTLNSKILPTKLPVEELIWKDAELFAILNNNERREVDDLILDKNALYKNLYANTTFPTVLIEIMVGYTRDARFFKAPKEAMMKMDDQNLKKLAF